MPNSTPSVEAINRTLDADTLVQVGSEEAKDLVVQEIWSGTTDLQLQVEFRNNFLQTPIQPVLFRVWVSDSASYGLTATALTALSAGGGGSGEGLVLQEVVTGKDIWVVKDSGGDIPYCYVNLQDTGASRTVYVQVAVGSRIHTLGPYDIGS